MKEQASYDSLDSATLVNLLLNPAQRPEVHKASISALSRRPPRDRTQHLLRVLKAVIDEPKRYDLDVLMATIDVLVLICRDPKAILLNQPASLGRSFHPDS